MQDKLIIVTLYKNYIEYAIILENIAKSKNLVVEHTTVDEYKYLTSIADITFKGVKIVFIGTNSYQ